MKYQALLCFSAWVLIQGSMVMAEDAATMAPSPVKPGRPHASSFDPHGGLTSEKLLTVAYQHMNEGRPREAVYTLTTAIGRYPDDAQLYAVRGSILLQQGQVTPALQDLERAAAVKDIERFLQVSDNEAWRQQA